MSTSTNTQTLDHFINQVFAGNYTSAMQLCDASVKFVVFREQGDPQVPIYGTHVGHAAGTAFFQQLSQLFDFGTFEMEESIEAEHYIVRFGTLAHTVKHMGKVFNSLWSMIVRFDDAGKICLYRMHEDTAALEAAMHIDR